MSQRMEQEMSWARSALPASGCPKPLHQRLGKAVAAPDRLTDARPKEPNTAEPLAAHMRRFVYVSRRRAAFGSRAHSYRSSRGEDGLKDVFALWHRLTS